MPKNPKIEEIVDFTVPDVPADGDVLDMTDVHEAGQPIPAGIYRARITDVSRKVSAAGNVVWGLKFVIQSGDYQGAPLWHNLTISPASLPLVKRDLGRLSIDVSGRVVLKPELFLGREADLKVGIREWSGRQRNEVQEILPVAQTGVAASSIF